MYNMYIFVIAIKMNSKNADCRHGIFLRIIIKKEIIDIPIRQFFILLKEKKNCMSSD